MAEAERAAPGGAAPSDDRTTRYVRALSRRSGTVLLLSIVLALLSALSLLRLRLDVDLLSMLPQGRERFADYQRYVSRFGVADIAVAMVRAPSSSVAIRFAAAFEDELSRAPEVQGVRSRVDLEAFFAALRAGALPRLLPVDAHGEVAQRLMPEGIDAAVKNLKRILATPGSVGTSAYLAGDPLGLGALLGDRLASARPDRALSPSSEYVLSPDGRRLLLLIRPAAPAYDLEAAERLAAALSAAEQRARARSGVGDQVTVAYTGAFAFALEDSALLRADMMIYSALALLGVLAVFYAGYRSLAFLPLVTWQIVLGTLVTFAIGLIVEGKLNAVSLAFAVIFYGLGIDAAIHFYTRFLEEWGGAGPVETPLARTIRGLFAPTTVAATTTAAAFVVIGLSSFAGIAQLGFLTALGMLLNLPASFVLLPAQIVVAHRRGLLSGVVRPPAPTVRLASLVAFLARHRVVFGALAVVLLLAALVRARDARLDTNLFHLRPSESRAAAVQQEIEREFGLVDPDGAVLIESPEVDPQAVEAVLRANERATEALERLREEGLVDTVLSAAALLPSRATQDERLRAWAALPRERAADELATRLAAAGFDVTRFSDALRALREVPAAIDPTTAPLPGLELLFERHVRRDEHGTAILLPFRPRDVDALEIVAEGLPREIDVDGASVTVTGRPLMERELHAAMRSEIVWFIAAVSFGSLVVIWLRFRDLPVTLAVLVVPAVVVLLLLALLGATGVAIDAVSLIVFPITVGLGVDNCVYLAERCRETRSLREAVASTGRPFAITAATTAVGFGVLALSRYPALANLGWVAAASMLTCYVATMLLLPVVLPLRRLGAVPDAARDDGIAEANA
ncbi:MAG TPA: MMPL family transporter [Candidatus Binatia bacterium]